jgi:FkbM family methyltransferase
MNKKQESLLIQFNTAVAKAHRSARGFNPRPEDMGSGAGKILARLLRYRISYLKYIWDRIQGRFKLMTNSTLKARTFFGTELRMPASDSNTQSIYQDGILYPDEDGLIRYFIRELKVDDIFYDIGANYGFYTALAQHLIENGEVHSFEPSNKIFPYLERMATSDNRTFLNKIALSDSTGELTFFDCYMGHASGKSTTVEDVATEHRAGYEKIIVKALTLDEYCSSHTTPTIIKMDVEGAESNVLEGGRHTLERASPVIAIELWSGEGLYEYSLKALNILSTLGYTPFFLSPEGELEETSGKHLQSWLKSKQKETNFIFKKINKKDI